jgi:hypothetical protein
VGGPWYGNETLRAPVFATPQAQTTTLVDNSSPTTIGLSFQVTVNVASPGSINVPNGGTVTLLDASNGNAVVPTTGGPLVNGSVTLTVTNGGGLGVGSHNLVAVYNGDAYHQSQSSAPVAHTINNALIVVSTQQTPSGVIINFNQPIDPTTLNQFAATVNGSGVSSATGGIAVAVTNGSSPVLGSLILSNNNTTVYFVKTGVGTTGLLPTGTNNMSLLAYTAATGGFRSAGNGNIPLTGTTTFAYPVSAPTNPVVGIPDFARGPGMVDTAGFHFANGIPLTITNGSGLTTFTTTITYNPADFNVSGVTTPLSGYSISGLTIDNVGGSVTFTVSGGAALGSGAATLANIQYTIPTTAVYAAKEALRLTNVSSNITVIADDAVHIAAYAGDVDGSGGSGTTLSQASVAAQDASVALGDASASAGGTDNAFSRYLLADPKILAFGDTTGAAATVNAQDASNIINAASHQPGSETQLPFTPTGITPVAEAGNDPQLFFNTYNVIPGQTVTIAINMTVTEASGLDFQSADLNFTYNSAILTNPTNIRVGGLDSGYLISSNTTTPGQIYIGVATSHNILANGITGTIALVDFTVAAGSSPGQSSPLNLVPQLGGPVTEVDGNPANVSPYPTTAANDAGVDGVVNVVNPTATLGFPATTAASAGSQIQVAVSLTAVTPINFQSMDLNITYNPSVLTLVGQPTVGTLSQGYLISSNTTTPGQVYVGEATGNNNLAAGTSGTVAIFTFNVAGTASGSTFLNITTALGGPPTQIDGGAVVLSPAPTAATNDPGVDGVVNIVIQPNQPPYNSLPQAAGIPSVLFNPSSLPGLQTATANTQVFSSANGDAITVSDSDYTSTGPAETTTVTVIGTPAGTSTGAVGTLSATASGAAQLSGVGTATLTITGSPTDITATLNGLIYTPGAGFFGTTTLSVSTNDNGNSGFGGSLVDTRTTSFTVVGLFLSEVDLLKGNTTNPSQYLEVFSTAPNYTIPSGIYFVGVNGATGTPAPGLVTDIFNLAGFTTGTNGYLALLEKGEKYGANGFEISGGNELDNIGTGVGFGNGGTTSKFGNTTNVHLGGTRPSGQLATDILTGAESFLLIQSAVAPTTTVNIDPGNTGNPTNQTSAYNNWNVLDSVGILNTASTSHSYAAITFKPTGGGSTLTGSTVVSTGTWTANYVGRIATHTGSSSADWLASVVTGTPASGTFNLGAVNSTQFAGQPLNSIGGPNDWAPQMTVSVNDGSSTQHSQVAELTLTFNEAVNIVDLSTDFQVKDAQGNLLNINVSDPNTGVTTVGAPPGAVPDSGATLLIISFNADATHTFNFGTTTFTDVFGNTPTVGLVDGNYFVNTTVADISSAANASVLLDGAHNGVSGSTTTGSGNLNGNGVHEVDEFWRYFGDTLGRRQVDGSDNVAFGGALGSNTASPNYLWYLDYNEDGIINTTTDKPAFRARLNTRLLP